MGNVELLENIMNDINKLRDRLVNIPDYIISKEQYRKIDNRFMNSYDEIKTIYDCLVLSKEQYLLDNPQKDFKFIK